MEVKLVLRYKWWNYYLQFRMNKLSIETKLFLKLFTLAKLVKFVLD